MLKNKKLSYKITGLALRLRLEKTKNMEWTEIHKNATVKANTNVYIDKESDS